jgi:hypothetical protein
MEQADALNDLLGAWALFLDGGISGAAPMRVDAHPTGQVLISLDQTGMGGSGIEVKLANGSVDVNPTTLLIFDQAQGFTATNPGTGQFQAGFQDCSVTQVGKVNLTSGQFLGSGDKIINGISYADTFYSPHGARAGGVRSTAFIAAWTNVGAIIQGNDTNNGSAAVQWICDVPNNLVYPLGVQSGGSAQQTPYACYDTGLTLRTGTGDHTTYSVPTSIVVTGGIVNSVTTTAPDANHTITLAKLTPGGAPGSITWTNGIITAHVDPS